MNLLAGFRRGGSQTPAAGHRTSAAQARVRIDSREYALMALDRRNLVIDGFTGDLIPRQRFHFSFLLPIDGETIEVPTRGVVLATDDGRLRARYLAPHPYHQRLMRNAIDSLPFVDG